MKQLRLGAMLAAVAAGPLCAQSADNFDAGKIAPVAPVAAAKKGEKPGKAATVVQAGPVSTTPSRFIGSTEKDAYLASQSAAFLILHRNYDPFGQPEDPEAKPIIKAPTKKDPRPRPQIQATPFADIVKLLVVTTIMPAEQRFMIGARSVKVGEHLVLTLRGRQFRVLVTSVTSREIAFKNLDNGETASRQLDMLPPGMKAGSGGISAPGMVPDRGNAPIDLDANDSTTPDTQLKSSTEPSNEP